MTAVTGDISAPKRTPDDERPVVHVGMLGYGFMGRAHAHAFQTASRVGWPDGARAELTLIGGRTEEGVRATATRYGFAEYAIDWRAVTDDPRVDVFDNTALDDAHVDPTLAAIRAGKHVICEKPLALQADDAVRLRDAADAASVKNMTCFNYRFLPAPRLAYEMLAAGDFGDIHEFRVRYSQDWRTDPDAELQLPAGALTVIGCHAIDQARFLVGEVTRVAARVRSPVWTPSRRWRGHPVDPVDTVSALVEFESGLVGTLDASLVSPGRQNLLAWEINGAQASASWSLEELNVLRLHRRGPERRRFEDVLVCGPDFPLAADWWPPGHLLGWEHGHINMMAHFLSAVAGEVALEPYAATFADGARAAEISEAIQGAASSDSWVTVPSGPDRSA
jgi:predicted dehydrogenase